MNIKPNINKRKLLKTFYIYIAIMIIIVFSSKTIYNLSLPKVTVAMPQSGRLTKELEARGVIAFSETIDIYAASGGQIDKILVKKGDAVEKGTLITTYKQDTSDASYIETNIAELGLSVERIENQLSALALNKTVIQDKLRALNVTSADDLYSYQCAVEDAKTALERRQAELTSARERVEAAFDDYSYQNAIDDAKRVLDRKKEELHEAKNAQQLAETGKIDIFDVFIYQQNIKEASIILERRKSDLQDAEDALAHAKRSSPPAFDSYNNQKYINTAKTAYDRSLEDYNEALRLYDIAVASCYELIFTGAGETEIAAAQKNMDDAQNRVDLAKRALDDAMAALDTAISDMERAENAYYAYSGETRQKSIAEAERNTALAKNAVDDAQRAYNKAVDELTKAKTGHAANASDAKQNAIENAKKGVDAANQLADDAELFYNRAVNERNRAADEAGRAALKNLSDSEASHADAQVALGRAELNLELAQKALVVQTDNAQKTLELDLQRVDLDIASAIIDLRAAKASLAAAMNPGKDVGIITEYQGVIIDIGIKMGQIVARGEKIATVGVNDRSFICDISCLESEGRFIEIGDAAIIYKNGVKSAIKATVYDITRESDMLKISISCETEEFAGGEYVTVKFQKQTEIYNTLVPNEAVIREGTSSFVWVILSKQGALGVEYYSTKVKVLVADMDNSNTAVSKGLEYAAPVVMRFDKDLSINGR